MRAQDRFVVVKTKQDGTCQRRTYTDFFDAAVVTKRCGRNRANKPCFLLQGAAGMEKLIGKCAKARCTKQLNADDQAQLASCRTGAAKKQARRAAIAARAGGGRVRNLGPGSRATPSRTSPRSELPAELQGRKRRRKRRR